jgi:hypothetical protein
MANDYSQVVLPVLLQNIENVFAMSKRHKTNQLQAPVTAVGLLENQTAIVDPIFKGGRCTGFSVAYQISDQETIGDGVGTEPTATCTVTPNQTFSGLKADYDITRWFRRDLSVLGKDCDSAIKFQERLATAMVEKMHEIALEINQHAISQILANIQTPTNTGSFGTINGSVVEYNKADLLDRLKFELILSDWMQLGMQELLPGNMICLSGSNMFVTSNIAQNMTANDDTRSWLLNSRLFPIYNDLWGFGPALANIIDTSFLVDPNCYVFFTRNQYSETVRNAGDANNTKLFSMPLRYVGGNGQLQTMMFNSGGVMTPVMVDCMLQYGCNSTAKVDGFPTYDYNLTMSVAGSFEFAPTTGTTTGIVQINAV